MISESTFKILNHLLSWTYKIGIAPWKWDKKKRRLTGIISKVDRLRYRYFFNLCLMSRVFLIIYLVFTLIFVDMSPNDFMIASYGIAIVTVTLILLVMFYSNKDFMVLWNGILLFNEKLMQAYGMRRKDVPIGPTEKFAKTMIGACIAVETSVGPSAYCALTLKWKITWIFQLITFPGSYVAISFGFFCHSVTDAFILLTATLALYIYANSTSCWLEKNICCDMRTPIHVKEKLRIIFRAHQIMIRHIHEFVYKPAPLVILGTTIVVISCLYAVIVLTEILGSITLVYSVAVCAACSYALRIACQKTQSFTDSSMAYPFSFQKLDESYTKLDKKFFKSVKPMVWPLGPWFEFGNEFFLVLMDFVINTVIELILWSA